MRNFLESIAKYKKKRRIETDTDIVITTETTGFRVYVATKENGPDGYPRVAEAFAKYSLIERSDDETGLALVKHEIDNCIVILRGNKK